MWLIGCIDVHASGVHIDASLTIPAWRQLYTWPPWCASFTGQQLGPFDPRSYSHCKALQGAVVDRNLASLDAVTGRQILI